MLAVFAPLEQVSDLLDEHGLDLVIANKNAPRQCVLSGRRREIERAKRLLDERGITTRLVPVSAAFHSRPWPRAEERVPTSPRRRSHLQPSAIPVFANATAQPYPDDPDAARALLAGQLARPVEFVAQIEAMYRDGGADLSRSRPRRQAHRAGPRDPRGTRTSRPGRRRLARSTGNLHDLACSLATLAAAWVCCRSYSLGRRVPRTGNTPTRNRASPSRSAAPTPDRRHRNEDNRTDNPAAGRRSTTRRSSRCRRGSRSRGKIHGDRLRITSRPIIPRSIGP